MMEQLISIAETAGSMVLDVYNQDDFGVKIKDDNSPLTEADKKSHNYIIGELAENFRGIPILSEEGEGIDYKERRYWKEYFLVDPLDGTKEFINRNGDFTVNIALIKNQKAVAGVIHVPVTGETFFGSIDSGSFKRVSGSTKEIKVSTKTPKDELTVVQSKSHSGEEEEEFYSKFKIKEKTSRGSSLKICMVAEGKAEIYFRSGPTWEWDTAAGHAILAAAGGFFVNKDGSRVIYNKEIPKNFGFIASSFKLSS